MAKVGAYYFSVKDLGFYPKNKEKPESILGFADFSYKLAL